MEIENNPTEVCQLFQFKFFNFILKKTLLSFFSKGSSVSIFSAEGISSASGTSEVGHVIVDELSDNSLNNLVEETAKTVRRMNLETRMFEGMSPYIFMRIKKSHPHLRKKKI